MSDANHNQVTAVPIDLTNPSRAGAQVWQGLEPAIQQILAHLQPGEAHIQLWSGLLHAVMESMMANAGEFTARTLMEHMSTCPHVKAAQGSAEAAPAGHQVH